MNLPRILIAGLRGGGGKTLLATGLTVTARRRGLHVAPFKKGPDYIDAAWLSQAAGARCRNLDLFLMPPAAVVQSLVAAGDRSDLVVIEGNRGLFDGMDAGGTYSTAELAKLLECPVALVVDCTKATRTIAAMILGCQRLDPHVSIQGVVLNQVAGRRHESVIRRAIEQICDLPVWGAIPRIADLALRERHLGLVPPDEHGAVAGTIERLGDVVEQYLNWDALWHAATGAPPLPSADRGLPQHAGSESRVERAEPVRVRIGVFRDAAFQFYYPENLEALVRHGAELVEISPLDAPALPDVDALYIGGGFPETLAAALGENERFMESVRGLIQQGLPVYAECGGAVFLGQELHFDGRVYPMAGVLPVIFAFQARPRGHGYVELETVADNPFYPVGQRLRGHEFHYTYMQATTAKALRFAFRVHRGYGFDGQHDGLCFANVLASYTHVHALGTDVWAPALVQAAARFRSAASREAPLPDAQRWNPSAAGR